MKRIPTTALVAVVAIVTLAFLYFVFPGHYTYSPFQGKWFLREKTDIFTGQVKLQILDLSRGQWSDYRRF